MPVFDLNEALERAVEEANKLPLKEPPLVLPPRNVVPISYGRRPEGLHTYSSKAPENGTFSPPAPYEQLDLFLPTGKSRPIVDRALSRRVKRTDGDAPCS